MTEKRFYYNTFYHADDMNRVLEYEIIDRQSYPNYPNHDEKEDIPQWYIYIGENDSGWQDMLVDLLNQLNDENEELKENCKNYNWYKEYKRLLNENEQLRQAYNQLKHRHSLLHDVCIDAECDRDSYCKDIASLEKENEQLKQFIDDLTTKGTGRIDLANGYSYRVSAVLTNWKR